MLGQGNIRDYGRPHVTGGNREPLGNRPEAAVESVQPKPKTPRQDKVEKVSEVLGANKVSGDSEQGAVIFKKISNNFWYSGTSVTS